MLCRVTLAITAIALLAGIVLGSTSLRTEALEYKPPPGVNEVNCGSVFSGDPHWALDEGCERVLMHRFGYVVLSFLLVFICGLISAVPMGISVRPNLFGANTPD
jgi:hypothetical protein